eukprot:74008_1
MIQPIPQLIVSYVDSFWFRCYKCSLSSHEVDPLYSKIYIHIGYMFDHRIRFFLADLVLLLRVPCNDGITEESSFSNTSGALQSFLTKRYMKILSNSHTL